MGHGEYSELCLIKQDTIANVKAPLGGDCNEGVKARPGQDVTMKIKVFNLSFGVGTLLLLYPCTRCCQHLNLYPYTLLNSSSNMIHQAKVSQPDGRGKIFFDKPSFELRFGKPNAKTLVIFFCLKVNIHKKLFQ